MEVKIRHELISKQKMEGRQGEKKKGKSKKHPPASFAFLLISSLCSLSSSAFCLSCSSRASN
jgi:hypothetical protein